MEPHCRVIWLLIRIFFLDTNTEFGLETLRFTKKIWCMTELGDIEFVLYVIKITTINIK